jgi:RimJ/RimL family protein N-acetyltransferase
VPGWKGAHEPVAESIEGRFARLEPLSGERHAAELFAANRTDLTGRNWTYLPYGPFDDLDSYRDWVESVSGRPDPMFFAVVDRASAQAAGVCSLLRASPDAGSIEIGHINYSPALQRSAPGTEAMFLLMGRVFEDWGYRRYEWKCNALNAPSMAAAERLGFTFEGVFRQALVVKGRNRDTAWFSVLDREWPARKPNFQAWLDPTNFDQSGGQIRPLARPRAEE